MLRIRTVLGALLAATLLVAGCDDADRGAPVPAPPGAVSDVPGATRGQPPDPNEISGVRPVPTEIPGVSGYQNPTETPETTSETPEPETSPPSTEVPTDDPPEPTPETGS